MNSQLQYHTQKLKHIHTQNDDFQLQPLDLDFMNFKKDKSTNKSKHIPNSLSDRKNAQASPLNSSFNHQQHPKTSRVALLEKKKNYSAAIRERNLLLNSNKKQQKQKSNSSKRSKGSLKNMLTQMKENYTCQKNQPKQKGNNQKMKTGSKVKNKSRTISQCSMSALDLEPIPYAENQHERLKNITNQNKNENWLSFQRNQESIEIGSLSFNEGSTKIKKTLKIFSKTITFSYNQSPNSELKELKKAIELLERQNYAYKEEICAINEQNRQLKKDLDEAKQYIGELKDRAEQILQQSIGITRLSFSTMNRNSQDPSKNPDSSLPIAGIDMKQSVFPVRHQRQQTNLEYYQGLIQQLQKQLKEAQMLNSGLELKAMMSEKKMIEETNGYRKKVAKQIAMWRQRCAHLRSANMKLKSKRQMSISMQISKDEEQ